MNVERFWIIESIKPQASQGHLLGELHPRDHSFELWGAQFTLLCLKSLQTATDILAAVSLRPECDSQDAMKRSPLFYAQRDAYAPCAGVHDLCHTVLLPKPFAIAAPLYVKGFCGNGGEVAGKYDVIVDVYFEGDVRVVNHFPDMKGGF